MQTAHKIELVPNDKQKIYFKKACGVSRFAWNWGLAEWNRRWKEEGSLSTGMGLKKEFNAIKKEKFPWVYEVTKYAAQQPFIELDKAWKRFFKGVGGKPKFKKKGKCKDSFYIGGDQIKAKGKRVKIPNLGWVKMRENVRFFGKIHSVAVSRTADRWFASFQVDVQASDVPCKNQAGTGIDLGSRKMAVLSGGGIAIAAPKPLKKALKRLKRMNRSLSRKRHPRKKGDTTPISNNFRKQQAKIAKLHARIANIRKEALHQVTTWITDRYKIIGIENLNVKGMLSNRRISREMADVGLYEFRRLLEYKAKRKGCEIVVFDRFFPSSKTCCKCGFLNEKLGSGEIFECPACGSRMDRDLNAAVNLDPTENPIPEVLRELTPVEIAALQRKAGLSVATSIVEAGIERQCLSMDRFA
jgi:putative transposase